ncbi:MAG TPA: hypothetical protein VMB48_03760 [Steroidobacteraceae bacterium]|nr:hypothetical protein [Steroidobacteraceae bacterium]
MSAPPITVAADTARRRRVRRTALLLGAVASAFYVGFIIMTIWRGWR